MSSPVIQPDVWATLDPHAGRLSSRARRGVTAMCVVLVAALALATYAVVSGHGLPRLQADNEVARAYPGTHDIVLHISFNNDESAAARVTGFTVKSVVFSVLSARPGSFLLRGGSAPNKQVAVRVHVRNCAAVDHNTMIPVAVVTDHWFGHYSRALFTEDGYRGITEVAWQACHGT